ncbi:MAG TPA: hypothetical protein VNL71_17010 [Chloroflexota bacterium]|nr:hypothetical protein [Chloroflexota bacterium]
MSGLFAGGRQVDSAVGALRGDGFAAERISIVSPDGQAVNVGGNQAERYGHPHDTPRRYPPPRPGAILHNSVDGLDPVGQYYSDT